MSETGKPSSDAGAAATAAAHVPDTLSLILDDIRLQGVVLRELRLRAPWSLHLRTPGLTSVHIIVSGSAWLLRDGAGPQALSAGDVVILPSGPEHRIQDAQGTAAQPYDLMPELGRLQAPLQLGGQGPAAALWSGHFRFDVNLAQPLIAALPAVIHLRSTGPSPPQWLQHGLRFVAEETARALPGQQAIFNRVADILLVEALRDHLQSLPEGTGNWLLALRDPPLSAALAAVHGQPQRDWTVPELAEIACLSRSAFAERFAQVMGRPPLAYLTEHRMRLAAWMLEHTRLSVARIAERVGYGSETAFSQAFKRHHGASPSKRRGGT